jgi:hypothetical protein
LGGVLLHRVLASDRAALSQDHLEFYRQQLSLRKSLKSLLMDKDGLW